MKIKLRGAQKGHSLLKRKSDALTSRFRQILQRIRDAKVLMGKTMRQAAFTLAEVNYAAGDISYAVREKVGTAHLKVRARLENVSGVMLPTFECVAEGSGNGGGGGGGGGGETGQWLGRGGQQVQKCREAFGKALQSLIELATLQTAFHVLDDVIRTTNRRVNALEHVVLPRVEGTVAYIISELDEQDREDFFRLKKVQGNKKKDHERLEEELRTLKLTAGAGTMTEVEPQNLLVDPEDADIFV